MVHYLPQVQSNHANAVVFVNLRIGGVLRVVDFGMDPLSLVGGVADLFGLPLALFNTGDTRGLIHHMKTHFLLFSSLSALAPGGLQLSHILKIVILPITLKMYLAGSNKACLWGTLVAHSDLPSSCSLLSHLGLLVCVALKGSAWAGEWCGSPWMIVSVLITDVIHVPCIQG